MEKQTMCVCVCVCIHFTYTQTKLPNTIFEPAPFQLKTLNYIYIIGTYIPPVVVTEQSRKRVGGDVYSLSHVMMYTIIQQCTTG